MTLSHLPAPAGPPDDVLYEAWEGQAVALTAAAGRRAATGGVGPLAAGPAAPGPGR